MISCWAAGSDVSVAVVATGSESVSEVVAVAAESGSVDVSDDVSAACVSADASVSLAEAESAPIINAVPKSAEHTPKENLRIEKRCFCLNNIYFLLLH